MVVIDVDGNIVHANSRTEALFGYPRQELLGRPIEILVPQASRVRHVEERRAYFADPRARPMGSDLDLRGLRRDGTEFPVEIRLSPLQTAEGTWVCGTIRDHDESDRARQAESQILESLHEKEALVREIHHREKNNLALIVSLLYLQATHTDNEETIRILEECQNRVRAMALVHEALYRSERFSAVDFSRYARTLAGQLMSTYNNPRRTIRLETDLGRVVMSIERAIPCGLILNELITNSLTHAFPDDRDGTIRITWQAREARIRLLEVADDGVGLRPDFDIHSNRTLGLRLLRSLIQQVDGHFVIEAAHPGTVVRLTFRGLDDTL